MAGNDTIATLGVDLVGRDISASATIDKVQKKAEAAGAGIKKSGEEAANGFKILGDAASRAQSVVSKILIPVALISTITSAIALMTRFVEKSREAREELKRMTDVATAGFEAARLSAQNVGRTQAEAVALARESQALATAQLEKDLKSTDAIAARYSIYKAMIGLEDSAFDAFNRNLKAIEDQANAMAVLKNRTEEQRVIERRRAEQQAEDDAKRAEALKKLIDYENQLAANREAAASRIASIEQQIFDLQTSRLESDERAIAVAQRRLDLAIEAAAAEDNAQGYAKAIQLVFELQDLLKQLRAEQAKAVGDEAVERFKAEQKLHRTRMKNLEEFERKLRESLGGGIFGEGAVAGGNIGALTSAIQQIADKVVR